MGSDAKARAARAAESASARRLDGQSLMPTHVKASGVLHKSVRGVVAAFVASARPLGSAGAVVGLVWVALKIVDRFQLWMTAAGVLMVVLSVASAFQEVAKQHATREFLDQQDVEQCKMITIPTPEKDVALTMTAETKPVDVQLSVASPALVATTPAKASPIAEPAAKPVRRNSSTIELGDNELTVVHCGTVIEIQGSRGLIMPHSLGESKTTATKLSGRFNRPASTKPSGSQLASLQHKLPLVIAFEISSVLAVLRHQIMVGQTVEFTFPGDENSPETVHATNVTPVSPDAEIVKSRHALQTCKLAREETFARAMGKVTMISPRNEPIKHHVDLIKYAEFLDDDDADLPLDCFI